MKATNFILKHRVVFLLLACLLKSFIVGQITEKNKHKNNFEAQFLNPPNIYCLRFALRSSKLLMQFFKT